VWVTRKKPPPPGNIPHAISREANRRKGTGGYANAAVFADLMRMRLSPSLRLLTVTLATSAFSAAPPPLDVSSHVAGAVREYVVQHGETLTTLSARFGVTREVLAADNRLDPKQPLGAGRMLIIDNRHVIPVPPEGKAEILINVPQRMLFRLRAQAEARAFPIAVGRASWPTPLGAFRIVSKEEHPTWDVPVSIQREMRQAGQRVITRMPPGPRNPLGDYWIGLSFGALGIHGTPFPSTIFRAVTHGCIRLHPEDIKALYADVARGTVGATVYEPVLLARTTDGLFLEAHRDLYGRGRATLSDVRLAATAAGLDGLIDWEAAAAVLKRSDGVARAMPLTKP
jgi:L,D-transpeptidase ErfK/SrfK